MIDTSRPLASHLKELREHLMLPFISNFIILLIIINYANQIISELLDIVNLNLTNLTTYSPTELIKLKIYVSLVGSTIICLPIWFFGFLNFSKPGLTKIEERGIQTTFAMGLIMFLIGALIGINYISPFAMEIFIDNDNLVSAKLSIFETTKLIISISIFCGFLLSLPLLTLFTSDYKENIEDVRKYMYILIILIVILGTPQPTLIINLCFLIIFSSIMEMSLLVARGENES